MLFRLLTNRYKNIYLSFILYKLIKRKIECLDYVIVHELSHLVEANHSTRFWKVVEENYPDYKEIKKQMKEYK